MIEGIDISNFGSFKNFQWSSVRDTDRNPVPFKTLNLLYGRNCSGKTTLSRIVRTLETGELPQKFELPDFRVRMATGDVTQANVVGINRDVRVFNRDFVEKHLGFLRNPDGTIEPFAVFGAANKDIEAQIETKTQELGSVESKAGLHYDRQQALDVFLAAKREAEKAVKALEDRLFKKANDLPNGIKHNKYFDAVNYTRPKLEEEIREVLSKPPMVLTADQIKSNEALIVENELPKLTTRVSLTSGFSDIIKSATELLTRKITPSRAIQDLMNDSDLQVWAHEGMHLHRGRRDTCGFCQQKLPADLWDRLGAHFNKASTDLAADIETCRERIRGEVMALDAIYRVPETAVYANHRDGLERLTKEIDVEIGRHRSTLDALDKALQARAQRIFERQPIPSTPNAANSIAEKAAAINVLLESSNAATATLAKEKKAASRRLRLNEVLKFATDIEYAKLVDANGELQLKVKEGEEAERALGIRVNLAQDEIRRLRQQQQDEHRGADRINQFLTNHFGHQGLRLEAVKDEGQAAFKFKVVRDGAVAHHLSEGESSLIAFCYFMAKLEEVGTQGIRPIIWIDDPISSLDANHVFFAFALIEAQLTQAVVDAAGNKSFRYSQLFISTHSLEFLKFLGRLKTQTSKKSAHLRYYLVAQRDSGSVIECMPEHLAKYTTEFNYLFEQIYNCHAATNEATHRHCFYGFGNNLRRFLEVYLFFKFPFVGGDTDHDFVERMNRFFSGSYIDEVRVKRIAHEYSHLGTALDRAAQPVDRDEIVKVACCVLSRIRKTDPGQYESLLNSIDKSDPLPPPVA
jgi:wobble nucleotide-excising tRNase